MTAEGILQEGLELARGEHSLAEVLAMAGLEKAEEVCPDCGTPLKASWYWDNGWRGELECSGCGWMASV